jgi:hypothetical protein
VFGLSSHLNALEAYNPNRTVDPFHWIPEGIYLDMNDLINENLPVIDRVSGYTNAQFYNALDADITSMPQFRTRLLQENGNNQATEVINLFNQYHY